MSQEQEQLPVSTLWGRVGTALSGATEARKYEDFDDFMKRWETLNEQVEALKAAHGRGPAKPTPARTTDWLDDDNKS